METNLIVRIKHIYGTERIYPVCPTSKGLVNVLMQKKCLNRRDVEALKAIGFTITVQADSL